jgi:2-polyprenyl-3-methyl-5-hydroxy-6-metoxy-1,4-benzoquinol methylase
MKTQQDVGRFFERYAGRFDRLYDRHGEPTLWGWLNRRLRTSMAARFEWTFAALRPMEGRTVLDIGCGSGRYLVSCLNLGAARVVGIDLSPAMLSLACAAVEELGLSDGRAEFICGDFLSHPFTERYDYAIIIGVMDYVADAAAFIEKLKATVRGEAVLSFPAHESVWRWQRAVRYRLRGCPLHFYRRRELDGLTAGAGFASVSIARMYRDYFVLIRV